MSTHHFFYLSGTASLTRRDGSAFLSFLCYQWRQAWRKVAGQLLEGTYPLLKTRLETTLLPDFAQVRVHWIDHSSCARGLCQWPWSSLESENALYPHGFPPSLSHDVKGLNLLVAYPTALFHVAQAGLTFSRPGRSAQAPLSLLLCRLQSLPFRIFCHSEIQT